MLLVSWKATAVFCAVRKDIARIYTIMRERELGITPMLEMSDDAGDGEEGAA